MSPDKTRMSSETSVGTNHSPTGTSAPADLPIQTNGPGRLDPHDEQGNRPRRRNLVWTIGSVLVLAVIAAFLWRAFKERTASTAAEGTAAEQAPSVSVTRVKRGTVYNSVPIPAEFRPYVEVELHAKVSGYVKDMNVDFGDRVKAGQLLATLEVPELQDQLHNAIAVQQRAVAEHKAAHLNYERLQAVAKTNPDLVAQQDLDAAEASDGTTQAAIAAAKAEVERYETLVGYTKITAPFDGVVTFRYVDPGALIQAGTSSDTQSLPVVRVSDNYHLRLDFPVEVKYVKDVHVGDSVKVAVDSLGGKTFTGKITRATEKVTEATRTMMTEIEVLNPNLELVPGMYAVATLKLQQHDNALCIPTEAIFGEKTNGKDKVYVVNSNNEIEPREVTLGVETPNRYEVLAGLKEGDVVMIAGQSQVQPGEKVTPVMTEPLAEPSSE